MSFKSFLSRILSEAGSQPAEKAESNWTEKRRSNRIDLRDADVLKVHLLKAVGGSQGETIIAEMKNVSLRGGRLIFKNESDLKNIAEGDILTASLGVDEFPIPVNVQVVRMHGKLEAAVKFKAPFPKELEKLEKFLEPRCLGNSLREIDPSSLKDGDKGNFRWYHGVNDTSLFSWHDESGEIIQQQMVFLEKVVEWTKDEPLKTGKIKSEVGLGEKQYGWVRSEIMEFDESPNRQILDQARTILESGKLDKKVKDSFLNRIKQ